MWGIPRFSWISKLFLSWVLDSALLRNFYQRTKSLDIILIWITIQDGSVSADLFKGSIHLGVLLKLQQFLLFNLGTVHSTHLGLVLYLSLIQLRLRLFSYLWIRLHTPSSRVPRPHLHLNKLIVLNSCIFQVVGKAATTTHPFMGKDRYQGV